MVIIFTKAFYEFTMINLVFLLSFENQNQNFQNQNHQNQNHIKTKTIKTKDIPKPKLYQNQNHIKTKIQNQNFKTSFGFGACLFLFF